MVRRGEVNGELCRKTYCQLALYLGSGGVRETVSRMSERGSQMLAEEERPRLAQQR